MWAPLESKAMALTLRDAKLGWRQRVQVGVESVALGIEGIWDLGV